MTTVVHVVGMDAIDVEALAQVLAEDPGAVVTASDLHDLLGAPEPVSVIVTQPRTGVWDYGEARTLAAAGHRVLLLGSFDRQQVTIIARLGLACAFVERVSEVRAFVRGEIDEPFEAGPSSALSPRERDVAELLVVTPPLSRNAIAAQLGLSPATVKLHTEHIRRKVGAVGQGRAVLVERIRALGLPT